MAMNNYNLLCDDFFVDMYVNTELDLPTERDTVLAFFERVQKQYPAMGNFYRRNGNYYLEEDSSAGRYRWIVLEQDRIGSGVVNPENPADAYSQHKLVLELSPFMLAVSHLDIDSLDVTFGMDFDYNGSHDEVIAEALLGSGSFSSLLDIPLGPIDFSPSMVVALSEDCRTQARISVESKTSIIEPDDREKTTDKAISLLLTVRQFPATDGKFDAIKSFARQCRIAEELMAEKIVPKFVQPLINVIAQKRMI
jgi:hypothetical protein